jgi:hypothetical protein
MSKILVGLDDDADPTCANDMLLAKEIADTLHSHYHGHLWGVQVSGRTGMADIFLVLVSGNMGFRLKLKNMFSASDFKRDVIRAGGEILERYNLTRGRFDEAQLAQLKTNFAGDYLYHR